MKVLVTGFDPFGGESINPAFESVTRLPSTIEGAEIITLEVPTVAEKSIATVVQAITTHQPNMVIAVGQAGGRACISLEKVAINVNLFRIPDNEGNKPLHTPVVADGPNAYFSTLPVYSMEAELQSAEIPATVSYTAGTFVCNHLMYGILHYIELHQLPIMAGFIHIPFMLEQIVDKPGTPGMELTTIIKGLSLAIGQAIRVDRGDSVEVLSGGTIC